MLLLLFAGTKTGSAPVANPKGCGFQVPNGFQKSGFQNCGSTVVGWMPEWGFRHDPAELERRLNAQNRSWYDQFIDAARAVRRRVDKTKSEKHRRALIYAAEAAADAVAEAIGQELEAPLAIILALQAAASATRVTASIKHAEAVIAMAWDDEDDEIMLLLN